MEILQADVLVVGGGTGGTAAAIQAARRGAKTILVSEFPWLGGMLTTAGVTAPDGNELMAWQTGIWGAFLRELHQRQPQGLDHAWVSFFTYLPQIGAAIFADWVKQLPNLHWIAGQIPLAVERQGDRISGVEFADFRVRATVTLDATELGDLLALAEVSYRWGWEWQAEWEEPSAPVQANAITEQYVVQAPTWVVVLQDWGQTEAAEILPPPIDHLDRPEQFHNTWAGYGAERFLNYGRLPGHYFMINWPHQGNDYGVKLDRLVHSPTSRQEFLQEAYWHTQSYARFLQSQLGRRYGLAEGIFPVLPNSLGGGAFALHPYYRESRRLQGLVTVREQDLLPQINGRVAPLPVNPSGQVESIAIGNYANDHHYPGFDFPLQPKSIRWGGRWTGTPFALPYRCLIPVEVDGLLVCEKNISVSHIANGATRLQPVVLGIGQAAGMAAALCVERHCQPRDLPVEVLQLALLTDPIAPPALIPLFNSLAEDADWLDWQQYYLRHPEAYPIDGNCPNSETKVSQPDLNSCFQGVFLLQGAQDYGLQILRPIAFNSQVFQLVTLQPRIHTQLQQCQAGQMIQVWGNWNRSGNWIRVEALTVLSPQP